MNNTSRNVAIAVGLIIGALASCIMSPKTARAQVMNPPAVGGSAAYATTAGTATNWVGSASLGSAALAASNDFAQSSVWGVNGTNATITASGGIVGLGASSAKVGGIAIGQGTTAGKGGAAFGSWTIAGNYGFAAGYYSEGGPGSFVYSDPGLTYDRSAITNGFSVRASGGTYFETPTFEVTGRFTAEGITSTGANTNTAATVWRSSGNETKASIDNETGAVVVRGEDSDLRYFAGGFRVQNTNLNASAVSSIQYAFLSPSASNPREVTIRWAMDTNSVHDGIVARIGPARSAGGLSQYIEIQLQTNSVITTSGTVRYYSQTFSTNYNGSASSEITAPGAWGFYLYNGSAGVATNLGAIVQIECASE